MKDYRVPLKIVEMLSDGAFHSGQQLGMAMGMSRAAINQHMHTLKSWGLETYRVTGKGYCLATPVQLLSQTKLEKQYQIQRVEVIPVIDSTNQYLMDRINRLQSGDACLAEYQQAGRGRRGRKWFSPFGSNLYLSMYWCLEQGPAAAMGLSLMAGIIMAEALQEMGAEQVRVKWPNDLYLNDRKLAGILVEMSGKTGDVTHMVIGAGLNLMMKNVDQYVVTQGWTSLQQNGIDCDRNQLSAILITRLRAGLHQFESEGLGAFIDRWKALDNFSGRNVKLLIGDREEYGIARGINEYGALLLEQEGVITPWFGGEISLRAH